MKFPGTSGAARLLVTAVLLVGAASTLSSCGDDDKAPTASASADQALPPTADVEAYFAAVASYDPDLLTDALADTEPGSLAADYAGYLAALSRAAIAAGDPVPGAEVHATADGYKACGGTGGPQDCVEWADFEGHGGKLTGFTTNGETLDGRLVAGDGSTVPAGDLAGVQVAFAYQSVQSDDLFVVVDVDAAENVTIRSAGAVYQPTDGAAVHTSRYIGRTGTPAGSKATVVLVFPQVEVGGRVTLDLVSADQHTETVELTTGG
jgi:hypothetical protein